MGRESQTTAAKAFSNTSQRFWSELCGGQPSWNTFKPYGKENPGHSACSGCQLTSFFESIMLLNLLGMRGHHSFCLSSYPEATHRTKLLLSLLQNPILLLPNKLKPFFQSSSLIFGFLLYVQMLLMSLLNIGIVLFFCDLISPDVSLIGNHNHSGFSLPRFFL